MPGVTSYRIPPAEPLSDRAHSPICTLTLTAKLSLAQRTPFRGHQDHGPPPPTNTCDLTNPNFRVYEVLKVIVVE